MEITGYELEAIHSNSCASWNEDRRRNPDGNVASWGSYRRTQLAIPAKPVTAAPMRPVPTQEVLMTDSDKKSAAPTERQPVATGSNKMRAPSQSGTGAAVTVPVTIIAPERRVLAVTVTCVPCEQREKVVTVFVSPVRS